MTILTRDSLQYFIPDTTHVLERGGGEAFVYLKADGTGHMLLDTGETRSGTWRLLDDGYATQWDGGQKGDWMLDATAEGITYVSRDGDQRVKLRGILFGNAKNLPQ
ncbi:hypothetical protein [Nitratireductor pacificus]|uniref:Uncharacterized protein n=1 Tax=Nitratireductor pacificus pht-3B TaxID=391937 RepID=K2MCP2_9HYPH|nr:hypothetical protein [Nitratireductor pacificus]EKF18540.1 hypothetical protein NA2_12873 [Nitratireductor pacificus pht-3B]